MTDPNTTTRPRCAWIIGASTGIGRELALLLAREGWRVVISARSADKLGELAHEMPDQLFAEPLDAADLDALPDRMTEIKETYGALDLIVYGAALWRMGGLKDTSVEDFSATQHLNVIAPFALIKQAMDLELVRKGGTIAAISSIAGFTGLPNAISYGTSKAALTHLMETLSFDLRRMGITPKVIHPGFVDTPMTADNPFPMPFLMSAPDAARRIRQGLDGPRFEIAFPKRFVWQLKLLRKLPYSLYFGMITKATKGKNEA